MEKDAGTKTAVTLAELGSLGRPLRVRVQALILDNFKSFPKRTRVPIEDGFSTVSGPNGSGKSNIIDALQFVLATSTSKGMRADRLSDLISTLGNKPSCKVELELKALFPGPGGGPPVARTFTLGRSVRRRKSGNDVRYLLDGSPIRLADLQDVMRLLGFPTSGQNFVLQNDVIRLTAMGPVARRQVLDELAGARDFDRRIALAEEELAASDTLTHDTKLILNELATRIEQLKAERDQALRHQTLTESKASLEEDLVVLDVQEAEQAAQGKEAEIAQAERAARQAERERERRAAEEAQAKQALDELEAELSAKGEGERMEAFREVEALRARIDGELRRAKELGEELARRKEARAGEEAAVAKARAALEGAVELVGDVERSLEEKQAKLSVLTARFEAAGADLQREGKGRFEVADRLRALRARAEELRGEEAALSAREREVAERTGRKEAERAVLQSTVGDAAAQREELQRRHEASSLAYREAREAFAEVQARRVRLAQQASDLRHGLETVAGKLARARQELAAAEACREQAHSMGGGRALSEISAAKVRGVHGPVAKLVRFDGQFAAALETAAGGRLHYVVVDDEHVASRCIALLKRSRAGRLSFAPLSKLRPPPAPGAAPRGKGIVGWAVDLVSAQKAYEPVLRVVFGDTLVVETLEDAKRLIGRYRMVTLEGDLVERNAIMSGGSRRGGGLLAAAARAAELVEEKRRAVSALEAQRDAAREAARKAEAELESIGEELQSRRATLAEREAESAALAAQLGQLETALGPRGDRLLAIEEELSALAREREGFAPRLGAVRSELASLEEEIAALDDPEAARAYEELARKASEVEAELRPLEAEVTRLRLELGEALARKTTCEERLRAAEEALQRADGERTALAERIEGIRAQVQELHAEQTEKQAALAALSSELTELARRRDEAREAFQAAHDAARSAAAETRACAERLERLRGEHEALAARAAELRAAAEEREIEVPGPEEAPPDVGAERKRIASRLGQVRSELERLGAVNHLAIEQYDQSLERHDELEAKIEVLEAEKREIRERITTLQGKKRAAFLEAFEAVRDAFAETYAELGRGEGRLILEDPKDPFAGGLLIKVRPRGKKLSRMESMSGGEKALTALSLIFALQEVNPAPLFIFDEVDKDLDGVNTMILAEAIRRRAEERQYLVISHHRVLLERSDQTLGVTMRKGHGTQVTGVKMAAAEEPASEEAAAVEVAS